MIEVLVADAFQWTCPTCGSHTSITEPHVHRGRTNVAARKTPNDRGISLEFDLIECPNPECLQPSFTIRAFYSEEWGLSNNGRWLTPDRERPVGVGEFTFLPTTARPLSEHVPSQVAEDYNEAYLIRSLSPKASATLARRALQGMVRGFFQVNDKRTLHAELEAIKDRCDDELYAAMMAVKSIGNIGAHPEKDASLMVDVEPGEAETLLDLIHLLDHEWYVSRAQKAARIAKVRALSEQKERALGVLKGPPEPA